MMWDTLKDYMNSFLAAFFLFVSIITIPEIKRHKKNWMTLAFLIIVLAAIGIDKVRRDNKDKRVSTHQISKLQEAIDDIRKRKTQDSLKSIAKEQTDSVKDAEFQRRLFEEFRITRDSVTNKPRQINFKTQINKARDVYIGSKN